MPRGWDKFTVKCPGIFVLFKCPGGGVVKVGIERDNALVHKRYTSTSHQQGQILLQ